MKRGTQSVIEQEEAGRREKEEARKRAKYAIKFKREKEAAEKQKEEEVKSDEGDDGDDVSDEDLSQYGDFVYQACEEEDEDVGKLCNSTFSHANSNIQCIVSISLLYQEVIACFVKREIIRLVVQLMYICR